MASGSTAMLEKGLQNSENTKTAPRSVRAATVLRHRLISQASAEHFQQCAEFLPLRNRGLGSLAVTLYCHCARQKGGRYPLRRRVMDSGPFSSL